MVRTIKGFVVIAGTAILFALLAHTPPTEVSADFPPELNWFTPSLALDSQGKPYISFWDKNLGNDLRFASLDEGEGQWFSEVVDELGGVGQFSSLAIDADDRPHISYYDATNADLRYAHWDGTEWRIEVVDATGDVGGEQTSLALDASGDPHISYYDASNGDLKFACWDPDQAQWWIQVVDGNGSVGAYSSLTLDSSGRAHISYYDQTLGDLKYARGQSNGETWTWTVEAVDEAGWVGSYTSLAVDVDDQPHISYYDISNGDLKHASWNAAGDEWEIEVVDTGEAGGDVGRFSSLVLDASGTPHIGYHDSTNARLRYARWDGSQWISETVDTTVLVLGAVSLKLDADDQPRIAYGEKTNVDLRYAFWDPLQQAWVIQTVYSEEGAGVGYFNSLELDSGLGAHIAYYDKADRDLEYAHRYWDGSGWVWDTQTLDSEGRTGRFCSLELDADDYPRIGYIDSLELEQSYAVWDGTQWTIEVVPNAEGMGRFSSMALDANDYAHFASYGEYILGLAYAHWDGAQWHSEVVDTVGDTGWSTSIVVDAAGRPHISYTDAASRTLRYAHWDGSQWMTQTVASIGPESTAYRMETSIALDASGQPCISYYDSTGGDLMVACWNQTTWIIQTIDDGKNVGIRSSLRFDGDGNPHIGYRDHANGDLMYARWDGTKWLTQTVDSQGDAGWYLSLALEPTAPYTPHLSYMEADCGILKYTYWDGDQWVVEIVDDPGLCVIHRIYLPLVMRH